MVQAQDDRPQAPAVWRSIMAAGGRGLGLYASVVQSGVVEVLSRRAGARATRQGPPGQPRGGG